MSAENMLEAIINENTVHLDIKDDINTLEKRHRLLREAGFIEKAQDVMAEIVMKRALSTLKNPLIVSRPDFERKRYWHYKGRKDYMIYSLSAILLKEYKEPKKRFFGGKKLVLVDNLYLVEAGLEEFRAHIPDGLLPTVIEGRNLGLKLMVWFVTKESQIADHVTQNLCMDPVIVGYPIVGQLGTERRNSSGGREIWDNTHAVILAMWGKDIEDISKYIEERR